MCEVCVDEREGERTAGRSARRAGGHWGRRQTPRLSLGATRRLLVPAFVTRAIELIGSHDVSRFRRSTSFIIRWPPSTGRLLDPEIDSLIAAGRMRPVTCSIRRPTRELTAAELRAVDPQLDTLRNLNRPEDYLAALAEAGFTPDPEVLLALRDSLIRAEAALRQSQAAFERRWLCVTLSMRCRGSRISRRDPARDLRRVGKVRVAIRAKRIANAHFLFALGAGLGFARGHRRLDQTGTAGAGTASCRLGSWCTGKSFTSGGPSKSQIACSLIASTGLGTSTRAWHWGQSPDLASVLVFDFQQVPIRATNLDRHPTTLRLPRTTRRVVS